jgi:serine/threonine protein kinase
MSEKDIRYYVRQVIEALMYIHSKSILHREYDTCYTASSFAIST